MILADTSAWVEYDRATGSDVHRRVAELIASEGPLAVTSGQLCQSNSPTQCHSLAHATLRRMPMRVAG
jgi:hypothetical protein